MANSRRDVGYLHSIGRTPFGSLIWPEGVLALIVGVGGGAALVRWTGLAERIATVGDALGVLGVLLGVVFAAFALLIALFSDEYVQLLSKANDGVIAFLRPFMIAIGTQVLTIFVTIGYRATARHLPPTVEHAAFVVWAFLFSYVLFDVVALTRSVMLHGLHRADL
jgi:hypothetical protein